MSGRIVAYRDPQPSSRGRDVVVVGPGITVTLSGLRTAARDARSVDAAA